MTCEFKINLTIFILCIFTPYIGTMFFILTVHIFILRLLFLYVLTLLIVFGIRLTKTEPNESKKKYYLIIAGFAMICYFLTFNVQRNIAEFLYYKSKEALLNKLVSNIKSYQKINELSDGLTYWKTINNTSIAANIKNVDTTDEGLGKKYFLDDVLRKNDIDKAHYELFKKLLIAAGFQSFNVLDDQTFSFTINGKLDDCYGLAYSETGKNPEISDCGYDITRWVKISDHWYGWGSNDIQ